MRFHDDLHDKAIPIPDEVINQRKIWRENGELCRQADEPLHLAEIGKSTGVRDLSGVAHHMWRAEKAGVVRKVGWVKGWLGMLKVAFAVSRFRPRFAVRGQSARLEGHEASWQADPFRPIDQPPP